MKTETLETDSLGFLLRVQINVGDFETLGQHKTYTDENGKVLPSSLHILNFQVNMERTSVNTVTAHEVYHLFYSIRDLISVDEETEAEVFGELVGKVLDIVCT